MRLLRGLTGCLLAGGLTFTIPLGPTTTGRAVDQIRGSATRSQAPVPPVVVAPPDRVWVPTRYVALPGASSPVAVPGHWERRVSDYEVYVPPLTVFKPDTGTYETIPAGVRRPHDDRQGP